VKKIVALTQNPTRDRYNFGVVCRSRKNPFAVFRAISCSDRLIFGGGTVFQDRTSLRSLVYYCVLAEIARANGVRVELWANGIGPIKSRFGRYMVSRVLRMSSRVGIRDSISLKLAYELGADSEKTVSEADLAFSVRPCDTSRLESLMRRLGLDEKTDFVVIAISGRANRGELLALKKYIADIKKRAAKCVFVGMYPDEDRNISKRFSEALDGVYVEGLSASELVALLSRSIGVCSMRFHLLVFADIAGVSYTGIGSDPKIRAFCDGRKRDT
jgi:N-acetylglucosaminyldiphosphoundecaprenol N-acetyl-beta-D-mannosaminyltransferase